MALWPLRGTKREKQETLVKTFWINTNINTVLLLSVRQDNLQDHSNNRIIWNNGFLT